MSLTITDTHIGSTLADDHADRRPDGSWTLDGPLFTPALTVTRMQAMAALTIADAIRSVHTGQPCYQCANWLAGIHQTLIADGAAIAKNTAPVLCLYCGSTDIFETRVTIDERHEDLALQCGECHGVWAA